MLMSNLPLPADRELPKAEVVHCMFCSMPRLQFVSVQELALRFSSHVASPYEVAHAVEPHASYELHKLAQTSEAFRL